MSGQTGTPEGAVQSEGTDEEVLPELGESLRKKEYLFRDGYHPMNNGSYGSVPRRVLEAQQRMMVERESNPDVWYRYWPLIRYKEQAKIVAEFVGSKPENLVFVENVTVASNSIVKSFQFEDGDQILVNNHTYGAVHRTLELVTSLNKKVSLVNITIPVETTYEEIIDLYTRALNDNPHIRLAIIDHITSFSAMTMPLQELIGLCHSRSVMVAVDGAHCPGQLSLQLEEMGADFYFGNLHKWLFAPRGCALLYIHPKHHGWIRTAVSSHNTFDEDLQSRFHYTGTRDNIPFYAADEAIKFHKFLGGLERITAHNTELVYWAADMMAEAFHTRVVEREPRLRAPFMCLVVLPNTPNLAKFATNKDIILELLHKHNLGVAVTSCQGKGQRYLRLSAQVYNYKEEYYLMRDAFIDVLGIEEKISS